jgi:hypothetical protein
VGTAFDMITNVLKDCYWDICNRLSQTWFCWNPSFCGVRNGYRFENASSRKMALGNWISIIVVLTI